MLLIYFWPKCLELFFGKAHALFQVPRFHLVNFLQPHSESPCHPPPSLGAGCLGMPARPLPVSPQWTESAVSLWRGAQTPTVPRPPSPRHSMSGPRDCSQNSVTLCACPLRLTPGLPKSAVYSIFIDKRGLHHPNII